jgi:hypothetical protein
MPDKISEEKSYREWLAEALAQDEKTWEALEEKVKTMRLKHGLIDDKPRGEAAEDPRDC